MDDLPRIISCGGKQVTLRRFKPDDLDAMLKFARALPEHDLLFLGRDLKHRKVLEALLAAIEDGFVDSLIAEAPTGVAGTAMLVRDPLGWSTHVGEVQLLVSPRLRGEGLGHALLEETVRMALHRDVRKLTVRMTPDQSAAIALFEGFGFGREALLTGQVMGRDGSVHDLAVLSQRVERLTEALEADRHQPHTEHHC